MEKIKRSFTMGGGKATLACLILIVTALAFTGCEQPDNTVNDYIITDDGTWEIYTAEGLLAWNAYVTNTKNYVQVTDDSGYSYYVVKTSATLMADISLADTNWTPVGWHASDNYYYDGTFDGNGYTISNLKIDMEDADYVGLFGYVGESGLIINLTLREVEISGQKHVGNIAGRNKGTIENCNISGTVKGLQMVGGIAGDNYYGTIENCSVSGIVSGSADSVGGIAGDNYRIITACYNTGTVKGSDLYVGGIAGMNITNGEITACYNTGEVSVTSSSTSVGGVVGYNDATVNACYWTVPDEHTTMSGIGSNPAAKTVKKVGENDVTWETAMNEMNTVLKKSNYGYEYKENLDSTTNDTMPLIIDTVESSN